MIYLITENVFDVSLLINTDFFYVGLTSPFLNDSCVDYKGLCSKCPKHTITANTVSVGAISRTSNTDSSSQVMENMENDIDIKPFDKSFNDVILEGIRDDAAFVIKTIRESPNQSVSLEQRIMDIVNNKCHKKIKTETKQNIAQIAYEVCTRACSTSDVDELLQEVTIANTHNRFSEIIDDIHMQKTYLRKAFETEKRDRTSRQMFGQIYISNIPFEPGDSGTCIYVTHPVQGCIGMAVANHPNGGCIATPIMEILKYFKIGHRSTKQP